MTDEPSADAEARAASFRVPPARRGGWWGRVTMVLLAALWVATWGSAFAAWGGWAVPSPSVVVLTFLPWLAGALVGLTFLAWTVFPDRRDAAALAVAAAVPSLVWWGPDLSPTPEVRDGIPLRVASWNVRRLWGPPEEERPALACVVATLRAIDADVLSLQEVTASDVTALEEDLGVDCVWAAYRERSGAQHVGLAVCAVDGRTRLVNGAPVAYVASEDWRYLDVELAFGPTPLRMVGVHLAPLRLLADGVEALPAAALRLPSVTASHAAEGAALATALATATRTVVSGDFNSAPDTPLHATLSNVLRDAFGSARSRPGGTVLLFGWIPLRIDHIYVSPDVGVADAQVQTTTCSDHDAVVADLILAR